jgi:hypothetical protein
MCYDAFKGYICLKQHEKVVISKILWCKRTKLGSLSFDLRIIHESFLERVNIDRKKIDFGNPLNT